MGRTPEGTHAHPNVPYRQTRHDGLVVVEVDVGVDIRLGGAHFEIVLVQEKPDHRW